MNKQEFLGELQKGLSGLPKDDIEERLTFYGEMIDDKIEDGMDEETAVTSIGSTDEILSQIISDIPLTKLLKEKITKKKKLKVWEIVLLALGSPIWLAVLIAVAAVIISVYVTLWSVIIALWSVFLGLAACCICGVAGGIAMVINGNYSTGIAVFAAGIFAAGQTVFVFFGCKSTTKAIIILTKKFALWIKNRFIKKEEA